MSARMPGVLFPPCTHTLLKRMAGKPGRDPAHPRSLSPFIPLALPIQKTRPWRKQRSLTSEPFRNSSNGSSRNCCGAPSVHARRGKQRVGIPKERPCPNKQWPLPHSSRICLVCFNGAFIFANKARCARSILVARANPTGIRAAWWGKLVVIAARRAVPCGEAAMRAARSLLQLGSTSQGPPCIPCLRAADIRWWNFRKTMRGNNQGV